jgi:phenylalanine ammonia-lyase
MGFSAVVLDGTTLSLEDVIAVARRGERVDLSTDPLVSERVEASRSYVDTAVATGRPIYGVTTSFGGMAHQIISPEEAAAHQNNAIRAFKCGAGISLPRSTVRAAMLLRANSHLRGASGIRRGLIERMALFLNERITPFVPDLGSIGASGDVVPLNYIAGSLIGADDAFLVDFDGEVVGARSALDRLKLPPLRLLPKEALAMINGTSVATGIAINCLYDATVLLATAIGTNALFVEAFRGTNQSFHPFIHDLKPHRGQRWIAAHLLSLLEGSALVRDELGGEHDHREHDLIQDRYMLRCLPQYLGPVVDGFRDIGEHLRIEANSANDNPLIDAVGESSFHGGNFLGQYVGIGMDHLRSYLGLVAKHLDVQIAWISSAEFNNGLPACLVGNRDRSYNVGLKGLQLCGNSIMPLLTFLGAPLVDRYPTHAEQFNQNVNSQAFGAANLARQSIALAQQHLAIALMFAVQAVDLRTFQRCGHYDARSCLSPMTARLYEAVRSVTGVPICAERPFVWDDDERFLDRDIERIAADIATDSIISNAVGATMRQLWSPEPAIVATNSPCTCGQRSRRPYGECRAQPGAGH